MTVRDLPKREITRITKLSEAKRKKHEEAKKFHALCKNSAPLSDKYDWERAFSAGFAAGLEVACRIHTA